MIWAGTFVSLDLWTPRVQHNRAVHFSLFQKRCPSADINQTLEQLEIDDSPDLLTKGESKRAWRICCSLAWPGIREQAKRFNSFGQGLGLEMSAYVTTNNASVARNSNLLLHSCDSAYSLCD